MYRLWFPLNSNKVGFIRSCHFQGQSKVLLYKSSSRSSFVHMRVKNSCFRWHSLKRGVRKTTHQWHLYTFHNDQKMWLYVTMCIVVSPKSCRQNESPWPLFFFIIISLLMKYTVAVLQRFNCLQWIFNPGSYRFAHAHSKWAMRDLLKAIDYLRGLTATFPLSVYLKKCHCANGGHISTLSSPVPSAGQQHWVSI